MWGCRIGVVTATQYNSAQFHLCRGVATSGPLPLYQPTFTTEQLQEAQHLANCYQAPHVQVQRAKMALALSAEPELANSALGKQIGMHPNTVFKWRKEWTLHGFHLDDAPRTGRPPIFSPVPAGDDQSDCL